MVAPLLPYTASAHKCIESLLRFMSPVNPSVPPPLTQPPQTNGQVFRMKLINVLASYDGDKLTVKAHTHFDKALAQVSFGGGFYIVYIV